MEDRLREYTESLFAGVPVSERSFTVKSQTLGRLVLMYNELLSRGKTPEEAYGLAIASLGDVGAILNSAREQYPEIHIDEDEIRRSKTRSGVFIAVAVALYILCPVPVLILRNQVGVVLLLAVVAAATGLIIFNAITRKRYPVPAVRKEPENGLFKALSGAMWAVIVAAYFIISFATRSWSVTWIIFLIGAALGGVLKAISELVGRGGQK